MIPVFYGKNHAMMPVLAWSMTIIQWAGKNSLEKNPKGYKTIFNLTYNDINPIFFRYMLSLAFIGKACSILFFFGAWWCYIPPKQLQNGEKIDQKTSNLKVMNCNNSKKNDRF